MQFVRNTNHLGLAGLSSSQEKDISFSGDNTHQANQVTKGQKFSTLFEKEVKKSHPHSHPRPSARPRPHSPALFSPDQKNHKKITKQKTILEKLAPANLTQNLKIKDVPTHKQVVRSIVASAPAISMTSGKLKKTPIQTAKVGLDKILSPSRNTKHLKKLEEPFNQKIITRPENEVGFEQLKDLDSPRSEFITLPKSDISRHQNNHLQQILANKKPTHIKQDHAIHRVLDLPKGQKKIQDSGGNRKENLIENIHKKGLKENLKENKVSFQSLRKPFFIEKSEITRPEIGFEQNHFIPQAKESGPSLSNIKDVQVLDLSAISSSNKQEMINQISTYIEQSYIAGADHLDVAVYHDELGTFKVSAQKEGIGNQINLQIEVGTESARTFFNEQEFELIKSLDNAGIKLSDLKIITSGQSFISGDQEFSQQDILMAKEEQDFDQRSREESSQNDSDRRKNLWQKFKESRNRNFA